MKNREMGVGREAIPLHTTWPIRGTGRLSVVRWGRCELTAGGRVHRDAAPKSMHLHPMATGSSRNILHLPRSPINNGYGQPRGGHMALNPSVDLRDQHPTLRELII